MAFGVTIIFLIIAYYSYKYIFGPLSEWLNYQGRLPEYNRDKDKPLASGQVWTDGNGRYFRIDSINGNSANYTIVLSDTYRREHQYHVSLPWHFEYHEDIEHFAEIRDKQRLHLTDKVNYF